MASFGTTGFNDPVGSTPLAQKLGLPQQQTDKVAKAISSGQLRTEPGSNNPFADIARVAREKGIIGQPQQQQPQTVPGQMSPGLVGSNPPAQQDAEGGIQSRIRETFDPRSAPSIVSEQPGPELENAISAVQRPTRQEFERNVVPQLVSQAVTQGAFGGAREGLARQNAGERLARALGDQARQLTFQDLQGRRQAVSNIFQTQEQLRQRDLAQGRNLAGDIFQQQQRLGEQARQFNTDARLRIPEIIRSGISTSLTGPTLLGRAGSQVRGFNQQFVEALRNAFNQAQGAPFRGLGELGQIISGSGSIPTGQRTSVDPNVLQSLLSGTVGGANLGQTFGDIFKDFDLAGGSGSFGSVPQSNRSPAADFL